MCPDLAAPSPEVSPPPQAPFGDSPEARARSRRLRLYDGIVRRLITGGGILIVAAVLGIFVFVFAEAAPLFFPARAAVRSETPIPADGGRVLALGEDEYREAGWALSSLGRIRLLDLRASRVEAEVPLEGLGTARVTCGTRASDAEVLAAGTSDGRALLAGIETEPLYEGGVRVRNRIEVAWQAALPLREDGEPLSLVAVTFRDGRFTVAAAARGFLAVASRKVEGDRVRRFDLSGTLGGREPTALALHGEAETLCVGTSAGRILRYALDAEGGALVENLDAGGPVAALAYALGSQTLLVGDTEGRVSGWQGIRSGGASQTLTRVRDFPRTAGAVAAFAPSRRDKSFLVVDDRGLVRLDHTTTERTLARWPAGTGGGAAAAMSPRRDGAAVVDAEGNLRRLDVSIRHPEVTPRALFGRLLYEGYDRPELVWQSTGGTDDAEPKLSLVPLVFGSLKGVFYAMLFSAPLALLAALYTSQFAPSRLRGIVKPAVEIMAALPSVVIGFLAGLWLSPLVERNLTAVAALFVLAPLSVLLAVAAFRALPGPMRARARAGRELLFLLPFLGAGALAAAWGGSGIEDALFGGSLRAWLLEHAGVHYDTRNCLVVGFALGFAVIPILYTVAEDAFSNVPKFLLAASEALGASRWQTAWRLVVPAASPGIFAAVMLGFGRAVGETMIVVMASGNTPILDFSIFSGMRTISACIATEMPEAPAGSSLYRVLFLAGALLFLFAFACNTAAELVGRRLRRRYAGW
ncbi:MAG TPA: ABC transporter permease subunit [Planctomycetota bacterium]|jgi:phosphate transport system permease protein|nr:ABC transporter permease subunit [Planctomycetota bacterium]